MLELTANSEKMYKAKFTQWGLMKNYKASEKEHLARIVKAYRDSGRRIPPLNVRNRAAKMSRVRRYCKQQQILEEICDALPAESTSKGTTSSTETPPGHGAAATNVFVSALRGVQNSSSIFGSRKPSFDPERPFSTASKDGRIELILFQTKIYAQSQFDCTIKRRKYIHTWGDKLIYGAEIVRQKRPAKGWQMIHEACEMTHQIFLQLHQCLLRYLLQAFHDNDMAMYPELRTHLLRFFTKVSARTLGCNHPISIVLYHWQEQQIFADVVTPIFEVMMDVSGEDINPTNDEVWRTKDRYCYILKRKGDYAAAESHGLRFLKQSEEIFGRLHQRTRCILLELGHTHLQQGQHELAESEYQDTLQRGHENLGDQFPDRVCLEALRCLAYISEKREDFAQCNEYWRQALAGAIKRWGMGHDWITSLIGSLERSLKRQGMDHEAWLQQNFGISWI
jgi:tetratricopeptide (TPR) repeat protein